MSTSCIYFQNPRCLNAMSDATFLKDVDENICSQCSHYSGRARGAGDVLHSITTATGISKVVKAIVGDDCGCQKRRAALNAMLPTTDPTVEKPDV